MTANHQNVSVHANLEYLALLGNDYKKCKIFYNSFTLNKASPIHKVLNHKIYRGLGTVINPGTRRKKEVTKTIK